MAAVQLLTDHHYWLTRADFTTAFITTGPSPLSGRHLGHVRWKAAARALAAGQLPSTGSEAAILQIAAGLAAPAGQAPRRNHRNRPRQPGRRDRRHHDRRRLPPPLNTRPATSCPRPAPAGKGRCHHT